LLLSGGSDSRLILGAFEDDITSFHMNGSLEGNDEAQTARKVAAVSGSDFVFLKRDRDYYVRGKSSQKNVNALDGLIHQGHAIGFADEIRDQTESIFTGHYSDTILSDTYVPKETFISDISRHIYPLSRPKKIVSSAEYIDTVKKGEIGDYNMPLAYLDENLSAIHTLGSNIEDTGQTVVFQGVPFPSWESVIQFAMIYPISNTRTHTMYNNLNQIAPAKYPFLDNRIVDIALQMPTSYRYKRNIVDAVLSDVNPSLGSIPHPGLGLPIHYPYHVKHYFSKASALWEKIEKRVSPKETNHSVDGSGSWGNYATLIRQHPFVGDALNENENRIRSSPYLDYDGAQTCYTAHLNGENYTKQLYALITVLASPLELVDE